MSTTTRFHDASGRTLTAGMLARLEGRPIPEPFVLPVDLRETPPARVQRRPVRQPEPEIEPEPESPVNVGAPLRQRLLEMCAKGMTQKAMAAELDLSPKTISRRLREFGLKAKDARNCGPKGPRGGPHDDKIRQMALHGARQTEIAKGVGLTASGVHLAIVRLGLHSEWLRARERRKVVGR